MNGKREPNMSWERLEELLRFYKEQEYTPRNALLAILPMTILPTIDHTHKPLGDSFPDYHFCKVCGEDVF